MKKRKLLIAILVGLIVGHIFAEGGRPFTLVNTLRFGYDDNIYRRADAESSAYVRDMIDFAFNASLSDRTELVFKSRVEFRSDEEQNIYPNLYVVLSHSVSPRLMLQFTEYFRSGDQSTGATSGRKNYLENKFGVNADYVLTEKDRLQLTYDNMVRRYDSAVDELDVTENSLGMFWAREIIPMRTRSKLGISQRFVDNNNRDSSFDATDMTAMLHHTFNQSWQGTATFGGSYVQTELPGSLEGDSRIEPLVRLGGIYSPSPRTRLNADFNYSYRASDYSTYVGQKEFEFLVGAQHDVTAKILAKALVRFMDIDYDEKDSETGGVRSDEERLDFVAELQYKLNRVNFIELRLTHRETSYDSGSGDWDQNMVDIGWRVEL